MGRHSAPDEDVEPADAGEAEATATTLDLTPRGGRHSVGDADDRVQDSAVQDRADDAHTQRIAVVPVDPDAAETVDTDQLPGPPPPAESVEPHKPARRESGTRADLRMLRHNAAVRAQVIGAVIVMFLLYTVVLLVIGKTHDYLQWLFVPIVAAGVAVGLVLDLAHRRAGNS